VLLGLFGGRDDALVDQAIDSSRPIERHQTRHRLAVIGHGDFLSVADNLKVTTEVISEFANASFHPTIMALFS